MHKKNIFDLFNEQNVKSGDDPAPSNVVKAADSPQDIVSTVEVKTETVEGLADKPADETKENADETAERGSDNGS